MKKTYVKPEVHFESFELSTNIAYACGKPTHTPTNGTCGVTIDGLPGTVFLSTVAGCKYEKQDGYSGLCYHQPDGSLNLFNS